MGDKAGRLLVELLEGGTIPDLSTKGHPIGNPRRGKPLHEPPHPAHAPGLPGEHKSREVRVPGKRLDETVPVLMG
jgi:hypothetical protein